jgi:hydrocephalus-inducing protein
MTIDTINLSTPVRRSVSHAIKIENPLNYSVTFQSECKLNDINLPVMFTVPANAEGSCTFEYQPLKLGEASGKLIFNCPDLGNYQYDLNLTASTAPPEKSTYFQTTLGTGIKFRRFFSTDYQFNLRP